MKQIGHSKYSLYGPKSARLGNRRLVSVSKAVDADTNDAESSSSSMEESRNSEVERFAGARKVVALLLDCRTVGAFITVFVSST